MKLLVLAPFLVTALSVTQFLTVQAFTIPRIWNIPTRSPSQMSCNSILVQRNPDNYPHCYCQYGSYGPYTFKSQITNRTCPSQSAYVLERSKSPLSTKCTKGPQTQTKIVCEPTLQEKARNFINALNLGSSANGGNGQGMTLQGISTNHGFTVNGRGNTLQGRKFTNHFNVYKAISTAPSKVDDDDDDTQRKKRGIAVTCPTQNSEKKICGAITDSCAWRTGRKRSIEEDTEDNILLARLVEAQDDIYRNKRKKRQTNSPANRNIIFVVDSSGSIGNTIYQEVLKVLSNFSVLFCGEVSIGLLTYSTHIDLEFCPTCHSNLGYMYNYLSVVQPKIENARYHGRLTHTGEVVKCLSEHVLPSPRCPDLSKITQVVFFTDGNHNGCLKPKEALKSLQTRYPKLETYSIGMGDDISSNGVRDLITDSFDPNNIFSVKNITELEQLLQYVEVLIESGNIQCLTTQFPTPPPQG